MRSSIAAALRSTGLVGSIRFATALLAAIAAFHARADDALSVVERVKQSIVAVGTYSPTRSPPFDFRGTGFIVGDGNTLVTNAHVLPDILDSERKEVLGVLVPKRGGPPVFREASRTAVSRDVDLALLKLTGAPLPAMTIGESDKVREGASILFTGFPIGSVLGVYPATHRGIVSSIVPIALPQAHAGQLDAKLLHRLASGSFDVFQLDATAYPGNSGSPLYDPETGDVLGVVNMVLVKGTREAALAQPSGIAYAVPSRFLRELLARTR